MTLKKLTLPELLKNSCSKFSKNLSLNFVASGKKTYQDLYNEVVSIANHLLHLGVKKGDKVVVSKYAGTEVKYEGEEYIILREEDILAIVE